MTINCFREYEKANTGARICATKPTPPVRVSLVCANAPVCVRVCGFSLGGFQALFLFRKDGILSDFISILLENEIYGRKGQNKSLRLPSPNESEVSF